MNRLSRLILCLMVYPGRALTQPPIGTFALRAAETATSIKRCSFRESIT
ncbi:MAG: hypothetical protein AAF355_07745 [Myxococcota bacterium]